MFLFEPFNMVEKTELAVKHVPSHPGWSLGTDLYPSISFGMLKIGKIISFTVIGRVDIQLLLYFNLTNALGFHATLSSDLSWQELSL
jgi:hypothetical protein